MTPHVAEPTEDQADDVIVVALGGGWSLIATEGAAILTHDDSPGGIAIIPAGA